MYSISNLQWAQQQGADMLGKGGGRRGIGSLSSRNYRLDRGVKIRCSHVDTGHIQHQLVARLVDLGVSASEGRESSFRAERLEVGPTVANGEIGQLGEEGGAEGGEPLAGVDGEDGSTILRGGREGGRVREGRREGGREGGREVKEEGMEGGR